MYVLNEIIDQSLLVDKIINNDVFIVDKILYIKSDEINYKFDCGNYWQNVGENNWINLQGGVPDYTLESEFNPDNNIFYIVE